MRINATMILMTIFLLKVSASGSFAQNITLVRTNASLKGVFAEIEKQTGYNVFYKSAQLKNLKPVTVNLSNVPLKEALLKILNGQGLDFSLVEKTVVIKVKEKTVVDRIQDVIRSAVEGSPKEETKLQQPITGRVTDSLGNPLVGATVSIVGVSFTGAQKRATFTDKSGRFTLRDVPEGASLQISYLGYNRKVIKASSDIGAIILSADLTALDEAEVMINTGYENIPRERATGSFSVINDNLFNRAVSTNLLDRLKGVSSSLVFDRNAGNDAGINIRGQSTIFANTQPLIILDNFPYEGDLSDINPNNIKNVAILKDAAAASIWGARAGNGVIVLTSKSGSFNHPLSLSVNSNVTIGEKPNLFYAPTISGASYAEVEKMLFANGFYEDRVNSYNQVALTPVVEVLLRQQNDVISESEANTEIAKMSQYDLRQDAQNYLYRKNISQQYNINLSGGSDKQRYYLSVGYDHVTGNVIGNNNDRFSINASNTYSLAKNKLEITTGLIYSDRKNINNGLAFEQLFFGNSTNVYPYARLADDNGNPQSIARYRQGYIDTIGGGKLLDWNYYPLNDIKNANNKTNNTNYLLNIDLKYKLYKGLNASVKYQYGKNNTLTNELNSLQTYFTRNYINKYSILDDQTNIVTYPVPLGSILDLNSSSGKTQNFRSQLNYDNEWNNKHSLSGLLGFEIKGVSTQAFTNRFYGYDDAHATSIPVDYANNYVDLITGSRSKIANNQNVYEYYDRYVSYFGNAAYTYHRKYVFSVSARKDASNIFGVNTNQKWSPFWSAGFAWDVSKESFYHIESLPYLRFRATYGYNGNIDKSVSAYLTTIVNLNSIYGQPTMNIRNPPNANLRWERNSILNIAVDFSTRNNTISGTLEYFNRKSTDLMGVAPLAPSSGLSSYRGNTADMKGNGFDFTLNTRNINRLIKWNTTLLFSIAKNKVTGYKQKATTIGDYLYYNSLMEGKPVLSVYGYRWAGLNPETGAARGFVNNEISDDYYSITNSANTDDLVYKGSGSPQSTASLLNTISYKSFSVSFNITGKFDYVFRRSSINYGNLYNGKVHSDYELRWQNPGDELKTNVPAIYYPYDSNRDNFYSYSEILIEKGDHIRLQDVKFSYNNTEIKIQGKTVAKLNFYVYANNLGVIWKATKLHLDPDLPNSAYVTPKSWAIGCKIDF